MRMLTTAATLRVTNERVSSNAKRLEANDHADVKSVSAEQRQTRRLVIFFHGIRGRGAVMDAIGDSWKSTMADTRFVSPDAPSAHRFGGRQWFAVDDQVLRPDRVEAARRAFDDLVADIMSGRATRTICRSSLSSGCLKGRSRRVTRSAPGGGWLGRL